VFRSLLLAPVKGNEIFFNETLNNLVMLGLVPRNNVIQALSCNQATKVHHALHPLSEVGFLVVKFALSTLDCSSVFRSLFRRKLGTSLLLDSRAFWLLGCLSLWNRDLTHNKWRLLDLEHFVNQLQGLFSVCAE